MIANRWLIHEHSELIEIESYYIRDGVWNIDVSSIISDSISKFKILLENENYYVMVYDRNGFPREPSKASMKSFEDAIVYCELTLRTNNNILDYNGVNL